MSSEAVRVMVRCRPMNSREENLNCKCVVDVDETSGEINLVKADDDSNVRTFTYDATFGMKSTQQSLYEKSTFPIVESVFKGYNGTVFAYGQTGCGKTFSMMGLPQDEKMKGIIPRTFAHILGIIHGDNKDKNYLVRVSFLEIYNEQVLDLLSEGERTKLDLKEHPKKGVYVDKLIMKGVKTIEEMYQWMHAGDKNRHTGATKMNAGSSRSHSIFQIYVETSEELGGGNTKYTNSKLNMVDLAGSERQSKTEAKGQRLKEAQKINLSLTSLGNVIQALVDGKSKHIPYRNSKLTRLLQDSLGGNTKTVMIAAISPASDNYDETLSTLRYASRAKNIKNKPKVNQDPKDALLSQYAEEIKALKAKLASQGGGGMPLAINQSDLDTVNKLKELEEHNLKMKEREMRMKKNLSQKEGLIEAEKKRQKELEKMLQELANQQKQAQISQAKKAAELEQAKKEREEMMQRELEFNSKMNVRRKKEKKIELGEAPRQLNVMKEQYSRLLKKIKQKEMELQDLDDEMVNEKFDYFDQIRSQKTEIKFLNAVIDKLIHNEDLDKIRIKTQWDDTNNKFITPGFLLHDKKVTIPKVPKKKIIGAWDHIKEARSIEFEFDDMNSRPGSKGLRNMGELQRPSSYNRQSGFASSSSRFRDKSNRRGKGDGLPKIDESIDDFDGNNLMTEFRSSKFAGRNKLGDPIGSQDNQQIIHPLYDRSSLQNNSKLGFGLSKNFDQFPFIENDNVGIPLSLNYGNVGLSKLNSKNRPVKKRGIKLAPLKNPLPSLLQ